MSEPRSENRPRRYNDCRGDCTVDCGHCKGEGPPEKRPPVESTEDGGPAGGPPGETAPQATSPSGAAGNGFESRTVHPPTSPAGRVAPMSEPRSEIGPLPRHATFNPNPMYGDLGNICREQEKDGYALVRIVNVSLYEAVAVFEPMAAHIGSSTADHLQGFPASNEGAE